MANEPDRASPDCEHRRFLGIRRGRRAAGVGLLRPIAVKGEVGYEDLVSIGVLD